jgi:uncharacterized protein (UPF0333 family)
VLALVGLVFYDVIAVVGTQQFTDGGASIMEAVARAKAGMTSLPPPPSIPAPILSSVMSMPFPDPTMAGTQYSDLQVSYLEWLLLMLILLLVTAVTAVTSTATTTTTTTTSTTTTTTTTTTAAAAATTTTTTMC